MTIESEAKADVENAARGIETAATNALTTERSRLRAWFDRNWQAFGWGFASAALIAITIARVAMK